LQLSFNILLLLYCFLLPFYCYCTGVVLLSTAVLLLLYWCCTAFYCCSTAIVLVLYCCCTGCGLAWFWTETGQRLAGSQLPLARHAVVPVAVWIAFRNRVDVEVNLVTCRYRNTFPTKIDFASCVKALF